MNLFQDDQQLSYFFWTESVRNLSKRFMGIIVNFHTFLFVQGHFPQYIARERRPRLQRKWIRSDMIRCYIVDF